MQAVAAAAPRLEGAPARRAKAALKTRDRPKEIDLTAARREFAALLRLGGAEMAS
jgi:hypothetical protein